MPRQALLDAPGTLHHVPEHLIPTRSPHSLDRHLSLDSVPPCSVRAIRMDIHVLLAPRVAAPQPLWVPRVLGSPITKRFSPPTGRPRIPIALQSSGSDQLGLPAVPRLPPGGRLRPGARRIGPYALSRQWPTSELRPRSRRCRLLQARDRLNSYGLADVAGRGRGTAGRELGSDFGDLERQIGRMLRRRDMDTPTM